MKTIYIKDLKIGDALKDELFRVETYSLLSSKNGSNYVKVTLQDKFGKVDGKIWNDCMPFCAEAKVGDIVRINGTINTFNNALQCIISKMRVESDFDLSDFIATSSKPGEELVKEIEGYINKMEDKHLRSFMQKTFADQEFRLKFAKFPAAKSMHHAYIGGLADHVLDMLQMSERVLANHPLANKDIVHTGIILHDIGKLVEFEEKSDMVFDYSLTGNMLGHIFIGAKWFNDSIPEDFPDDLRLRMTHIILSHHGKLEFGSPVTPKTYEAIIINKLDDMSANLNKIANTYDSYNGVNDFSERIHSLGGEILYLRPYTQETAETIPVSDEDDIAFGDLFA